MTFELLEARQLLTGVPSIADITVVQANSTQTLSVLAEGDTLDITKLGAISLNADPDSVVTSIVFSLDGKVVQTDLSAPYDIQGNLNGLPVAWSAPAGAHTLVVTPYVDTDAGIATTLDFTVINPTKTTPPPGNPPPLAPPAGSAKLTGTVVGTQGSYLNLGNTISNVFDGSGSTFFDSSLPTGSWVGLDLGSPQQVTQVQFVPRTGFASRMIGGFFQGSNTPDFSSGVTTLFKISSAPTGKVFTAAAVNNGSGFRYVRYLSPTNSSGNVAELEFDGKAPGTVTSNPPPGFPTSVKWTTGASSPIVRAEAVGGMVNGLVYVFGGFNNQGSEKTTIPLQSRCDVYNPSNNSWKQLKSFPEPFTHSEEVVVGSDIWFVGGYIGNHPGPGSTHVWVYHTTNDTWTRGPDLPQPRGAGAAALVGDTIYFSGGMDKSRKIDESTTYALNLDDDDPEWEQLANLPNGRNHVAGASLGGYFYVIGGQHGQEDNQAAQSELDRYDPKTNTWQKMASLPTNSGKSHITEGTLVYDGRIIVIGGETGYDNPQRYIVDYDPVKNTWNQLGLLPAARSTVVAGIIGNKLVVTTGNGPSATNTTWIGTLS